MGNKKKYTLISIAVLIPLVAIVITLYYVTKTFDKIEKIENVTNELNKKIKSDINFVTATNDWVKTGSPSLTGLGSYPVVSVVNQNTIFIAGGSGSTPKIYRSTDAGTTFTSLPVAGIFRIIWCVWAVDNNTVYVGDGGNTGNLDTARVYKTTNAGVNWTVICNTAPKKGFINGIVFSKSNPQIGIIHCDGNSDTSQTFRIWKTIDGGSNWTLSMPSYPAGSPGFGAANSVFVVDANFFGFGAVSSPLRISVTTNGGVNWTFNSIPASLTGGITTVAFNDDKLNGLAGTTNISNRIAKTTNGGLNWSLLSIPSTVTGGYTTIKYVPGTSSAYLVVSSATKTEGYNTSDNGATWSLNGFPAGTKSITHFDVWFLPGDAANLSAVYSSATNGNSFTLTDSPMPVEMESFTYKVNANSVDLKWKTTSETNNKGFDVERNNGSGWQTLGFVKASMFKRYDYSDKGLQSGKYTYRLKQIDNNGNFEYHSLNGEVEIGIPKKYSLSQNYPNPFNPSTKINFEIPKDELVTLKLYDMSGREVAILVNEQKTAGFYVVEFKNTNLASGVYVYKFTAGSYSQSKKMSLTK